MLHLGDLRAHLHPQFRIQGGQRLVHQEHLRLPDDRPAHGDALALAAGELLGLPVEERAQLEHVRCLLDPAVDLGLVHVAQAQAVGDVVPHAHVWVEGVGLEHHRDVPLPGRQGVDHPVADAHRAGADVLESGDHAQGGGLAAARRPHQHEELAVGDVEVEVTDRVEPVLVELVDLLKDDLGHRNSLRVDWDGPPQPLTAPAVRPPTM